MNIKIDLNITLPDALIQTLTALLGSAVPAAAPATKPKAEKAASAAATVTLAEPAADPKPEPEKAAAPVHVTDEMIVSAADAAVVKVGSNPMIIKNAIAAKFQKEDGSPATLKTVSTAQRPAMHAFLLAVAQTGNVNAAA